ncbi:hypothetical protein T492DRAFT_860482 [Pavlovales sp. CCMP2436]|nr:hypothetical protein T492DRAFT_860482 [Pavlovales sp. CCMP2436]
MKTSIEHARADIVVKGEDTSRSCTIELEPGSVVLFFGVFDGHGGPRTARYCCELLPLIAANKGATAAPARLRGDTARPGSIPCKHQGHLQLSGPTSGRGAAEIRVSAA